MRGGASNVGDDGVAIAEAEAFVARLERVSRVLPPVRHALSSSSRRRSGGGGGGGTVMDNLRAASAFEAIVAGTEGAAEKDDGEQAAAASSTRTTWYSAGKRHLHQPQLEALAQIITPLAAAPRRQPRRADAASHNDLSLIHI